MTRTVGQVARDRASANTNDHRAQRHLPVVRQRSVLSRLLSGFDRLTARPALTVVVLVADLCWVAFSILYGFPTHAEVTFQTLVAALTLAMVFVIQHTQWREQQATQRKLDEILHALPSADDSLLSLEHASDVALQETGETHRAMRDAALVHDTGGDVPRPG
jgi:low affinity Fe/Cu permease